ncbi:MAG: hypothetical protein ABIO83_10120 [Ilumatobacteraceae bacterium]
MCDTWVSITDAGVLFAKNSDRDPNESQRVTWHRAEHHDPGDRVACTWIEIPQVAHTHATMLSRPWWMWGAEMGANEHGLTIGNEAVYTTDPMGPPALVGMDLVRLGLERSVHAADAVEVMVGLLERHGQGGRCSYDRPGAAYHNSFLIADPTGAFVLETAGRHWAVETVQGRGRSISNGLTISGFAERFADHDRNRQVRCAIRRSRTEALAIGVSELTDVFSACRDHGADGVAWSPTSGALDGPCVHAGGSVTSTQTTASWVGDLRGGNVHWVTGTAAPCTSLFHPVRVSDPVHDDVSPTNRSDDDVRWWRHERVHRVALRDLDGFLTSIRPVRDEIERSWAASPPSTPDALAIGDALDERWVKVLGETPVDRRPSWLAERWVQIDRAATTGERPEYTTPS